MTIDPPDGVDLTASRRDQHIDTAHTLEALAPERRTGKRLLDRTLDRVDRWIPARLTSTYLSLGSVAMFGAALLIIFVSWVLQTPLLPGQGTVIGGLGVLAAGVITYYGTHLTRMSNERIAEAARLQAVAELAHERDKLTTSNERDDIKATRTETREQERGLRARFTTSAAQLADPSPTVRLAGVFSLVSLADDWEDFGNIDERNVCVELLRSYVIAPQVQPSPGSGDAAPFLEVRAQIARTLHNRQSRSVGTGGRWWMPTGRTLLHRARLEGVDFSGADLKSADLTGANLTGASLTSANLTGSNLHSVYLVNANLIDTILTGVLLTGGYVEGANFTGADVTGAELKMLSVSDSTIWPDGSHEPPLGVTCNRAYGKK